MRLGRFEPAEGAIELLPRARRVVRKLALYLLERRRADDGVPRHRPYSRAPHPHGRHPSRRRLEEAPVKTGSGPPSTRRVPSDADQPRDSGDMRTIARTVHAPPGATTSPIRRTPLPRVLVAIGCVPKSP